MNTNLQRQFEGFLNTPPLWENQDLFHINQFDFLFDSKQLPVSFQLHKKLRLGQLVEQFAFAILEIQKGKKLLARNIQICKEKVTIGEIDALVQDGKSTIHLEIVYKFYLLDQRVGLSDEDHWIGPNRKDSLIQKVSKLQEKQFPLLYKRESKSQLKPLTIAMNNVRQEVLFKAQLFVPYGRESQAVPLVNSECVVGYYITMEELTVFRDCQFHHPTKLDWLVTPHQEVPWLNYQDFYSRISPLIQEERSQLCWIRNPKNELTKCFVVWWL